MQETLKRKKNGGGADHLFHEKCQKWLADAKAGSNGLDALLEDSRQFTQQLLEEIDEGKRIRYFEQAADQLLQSCFSTIAKPEEIKIHLWKGQTYEQFGAWDKALSAFQCVIDLCDSEEFASQKAKAHRFRGHIGMMQGQFVERLKSYQESLRVAQDCGDEKGEAYSYNGLAAYYFETGVLDDALSYWEKALKLAEKMNDVKMIAEINNNLGIVANVNSNWERALSYYGASLPRFEKIGDLRGLAKTYHNMAKTYADTQRWREAGKHYEKSYKYAKEVGDTHTQADIKLNRAELYIAIGDSSTAETLCYQALRTYLQLEDHLGQADAFKILGVIHSEKQDWPAAQSCFEKGIKLGQKNNSPLCEAETRFEYGWMLKQIDETKSARKQYERALKLFGQVNAQKQIAKVEQERTFTNA